MPLTNEERLLVNSEVALKGKNMLLSYVLLIFLGGLGIHRFYLGQTGTGTAMLILTIIGWITTFIFIGFVFLAIVGIWWFIDLFLVPGMVNSFNHKVEREAINSLGKQDL